MSSFANPHHMYLFEMRNGKKKLAYGSSPENAIEILRMRLTEEEIEGIFLDQFQKINPRKIQEFVDTLG